VNRLGPDRVTDRTPVVVIGAGMGGLAASITLAARSVPVVLLDQQAAPGGKMREVEVGDARIDGGPTVMTMPWVFDELFAEAGAEFRSEVGLEPAGILARHAWDPKSGGGTLDLHADLRASADAIGAFAGAGEARGFLAFAKRAGDVYRTLEGSFIRNPNPSPLGIVSGAGLGGLARLLGGSPFAQLWDELGRYFRDPRLRQLFGRYATYCGSSPFDAPATLMLIAHVEQQGVWMIRGGMHQLALAMARLAERRGVTIRYDAKVASIEVESGRATAVHLATGERIGASGVIAAVDIAAVKAGRYGRDASLAVSPPPEAVRSLSALTWAMTAEVTGFPLTRHGVFFGPAYRAEFDAIFRSRRLPSEPTIYVCAQDRDDRALALGRPERLLVLVNAPPVGDRQGALSAEIDGCWTETVQALERCGLQLRPTGSRLTGPAEFETLFPGSGGALYGMAVHGWRASFRRPGAETRIPNLVMAGGSVHPGPGVPMATLSGRFAAGRLLSALGSTRKYRPTAIAGGTSTR